METYPNPDNTDPTTLDRLDLSEAPVTVRSNDRGHKLGKAEGAEEGSRGALHEEGAVRTHDEDEGLRDGGDLEEEDCVQLEVVVVIRGGRRASGEGDTEVAVEPVGADADSNERDPEYIINT